jgi:hypothetical protein
MCWKRDRGRELIVWCLLIVVVTCAYVGHLWPRHYHSRTNCFRRCPYSWVRWRVGRDVQPGLRRAGERDTSRGGVQHAIGRWGNCGCLHEQRYGCVCLPCYLDVLMSLRDTAVVWLVFVSVLLALLLAGCLCLCLCHAGSRDNISAVVVQLPGAPRGSGGGVLARRIARDAANPPDTGREDDDREE